MNAEEAIKLCRFVKAACPQQAIDEYTPDAWLVLLEPYRFEDCRQAAVDLARAEPFVAPAEIIQRVKAIRGKRIAEFGPIEPPPEVTSGQRDYREWFIETRTAIGDGILKPEPREIDRAARERLDRMIEGTFRDIDEDEDD